MADDPKSRTYFHVYVFISYKIALFCCHTLTTNLIYKFYPSLGHKPPRTRREKEKKQRKKQQNEIKTPNQSAWLGDQCVGM